jgi:organic hydroperoxide reductase OsmC/OhrA
MSKHEIKISWKNSQNAMDYNTYNRTHTITFNGGQKIEVTSAPEYLGNAELANPEEMLAAALSSCHMLTFLAIASKSKLIVASYEDHAIAHLDKDPTGKIWIQQIELNPKTVFIGVTPDSDKLKSLHEKAHHNCFIANSIKSNVITNL